MLPGTEPFAGMYFLTSMGNGMQSGTVFVINQILKLNEPSLQMHSM